MFGSLLPFSIINQRGFEQKLDHPNYSELSSNQLQGGFNSLPNEITALILSYLSPLDRLRISPIVCRRWQLVSLTERKQTKHMLYTQVGHPVDQLLLVNNFFEKLIKHVNFSENEMARAGKNHNHKYVPFNIVFDCDTLKAEIDTLGKWGNMRQLHHIVLSRTVNRAQKYHFLSFSIKVDKIGLPERALPLYWLKQKSFKLISSIEKALNFELQHHIQCLSKQNIHTLLPFIKPIKNLAFKLIFSCNQQGLLIDQVNEGYRDAIFTLEAREIKQASYLIWRTFDIDDHVLYNFLDQSFSLEQAMRWCVLSKTVEGLTLDI